MKVKLIKLSNKLTYYIRTKENDLMTALIDDLLKIEERDVPWYSVIATKKLVMRKEFTRKFQVDNFYGYIPIPMIDIINYRLRYYDFQLEYHDDNDVNLDVTEELESQLRDVYKEHSDKILDLLKDISRFKRGLVNLPTSFGKSWSICGLAKIYLNNNKGKVLIIAQGSAVVNEIKSRIPLFNVDSSRLMIENAVSLRSQRFYSEGYKKIISQTELIIVDECDSVFNTMQNFFNNHDGYKTIIGFTATSDYSKGQKLNNDVSFNLLKNDVYRILAYVGPEFVSAVPEANINLVVAHGTFSYRTPFMESEYLKFKQAVEYVICTKKFIKFLEYVNRSQRDTLYIPINNTKLIDKLMGMTEKLNSPLVGKFIFWDAGNIIVCDEKRTRFRNHVELNKYLLEIDPKTRPNIIITTRASYRGVSLPSLTDILFVENSNFRNVPQSIGRTMRSENPTIWLPIELSEKNILFKAMSLKRLKIINQTYPNLHKEFINFDKMYEDM